MKNIVSLFGKSLAQEKNTKLENSKAPANQIQQETTTTLLLSKRANVLQL